MAAGASTPAHATIWVLDVPFAWRAHASAAGARWDSVLRASVWRGPRLPPELAVFEAPPWSVGWHTQNRANGRVVAPPTRTNPVFAARLHQQEGAEAIAAARAQGAPGFVLADEVGVGKTITAWDFALHARDLPRVLIVTTASALAHWRATIRHTGWRPDQDITIINYDRLGALFEEPEEGLSSTRAKGKRKRLAKQGAVPAFDLIVFDESHKGKNPASARGLMMRRLGARARFVVYASATAGQNPLELVYLARPLAYASGARKVPDDSVNDFAAWCQSLGIAIGKGAYGALTWERNAADTARMERLLFGPTAAGAAAIGIRRRPEDVRGWPAMVRSLEPVALDPQGQRAYGMVWAAFAQAWSAVRAPGAAIGPDGGGAAAQRARAELERNRLRLRQESSLIRVDSTVEQAQDLLEQGVKVAVSVAFLATMERLAEAFEQAGVVVARIHGAQGTAEKEAQRRLFQEGPAQVVVFTVEEAISLHQGEYLREDAPRVLLIHDIRWSAIQMAQIEGRCHRDGRAAPVRWMMAEGTVDEDIARVMLSKVLGMKALHGDDTSELEAIARALETRMQNAGR